MSLFATKEPTTTPTRRVLSSYTAPPSSNRNFVSQLVHRIEQKASTPGTSSSRSPPLAQVEDDAIEDGKSTTKPHRKKYQGSPLSNLKLLGSILPSSSDKENVPEAGKRLKKSKSKSRVEPEEPGPTKLLRLKRTLTDSTNNHSSSSLGVGSWRQMVSTALGGPLKKRLSEGAVVLPTAAAKSSSGLQRKQSASGSTSSCVASSQPSSPSFFGALIRLSTSAVNLAAPVRELRKSKTCQVTPDRPTIPSITVTETRSLNRIDRSRPSTVDENSLTADRRPFVSRRSTMSRTMSLIPTTPALPPLYEEEATSTMAMVDAGAQKRRMRRYGGSHTTSTYQGRKDVAPDASPRRHLIGFLHRTSHLSLTSELSANASFYLIGMVLVPVGH